MCVALSGFKNNTQSIYSQHSAIHSDNALKKLQWLKCESSWVGLEGVDVK